MVHEEAFPSAARVRRPVEFDRVFSARLTAAGNGLVLHAAPSDRVPPVARLGMSVSRRVGTAVIRARWKRRLREAFRRIRTRLPAADYVVVVKARDVPRGAAGARLVEETLESLARRVTARRGFGRE